MHETEAEAAFKAAHETGSTAHARRDDSDLETDTHDEAMNTHVPTRPYEICHAQVF